MRRIILTYCLLGCLLVVNAQHRVNSFLEFSAGAGWSTLTYRYSPSIATLNATQTGSYNFTFHAGYGLLFNSNVGLGIGVDVSRYGAATRLSGDAFWNDVTDTDGERYNHYTHINKWNDSQELLYAEVPLTLYFFAPTQSSVWVSGEIGIKYGFPFKRRTAYSGSVTHRGLYPDWGMTAENMPNHGFTERSLSDKQVMGMQHQLFAFAKLGVMMPIGRQTYFFTHLYAACGMMNAVGKNGGKTDIGFRDESAESEQFYSFMPAYTSIINSSMTTGKFLPLSVGLEVGIRIRFSSSSAKYPCRCFDVEY